MSTLPPPPPAADVPATSTLAVVALVLGILSWLGLFFVGGVAAVICGHMARTEIRNSRGALGGDALAVTGLVLGYANIAICVLAVLAALLFFGGMAAFIAFMATR